MENGAHTQVMFAYAERFFYLPKSVILSEDGCSIHIFAWDIGKDPMQPIPKRFSMYNWQNEMYRFGKTKGH
jgi:hypothetical protein